MQYSYFSVISGFAHKTVHPFRNFLGVLPSPTLYKVEARKKIWMSTFFVRFGGWGGGGGGAGWGGGGRWTCVNWKTPQKCKYPKIVAYRPPIYASSTAELTTVQNFLKRSFKRKCICYEINIYDVVEEADRAPFKKISSMPGHPLYPCQNKLRKFCAPPSSQQPTP